MGKQLLGMITYLPYEYSIPLYFIEDQHTLATYGIQNLFTLSLTHIHLRK